jgi:energy-coupling factor transporter ATP-binding protein EcfA2
LFGFFVHQTGKSTLLRRLQAGKIPGLSPHLSTLYLPQEVHSATTTGNETTETTTITTTTTTTMTPLDIVLGYHDTYIQKETAVAKGRISELEDELEQLQLGGGGGGSPDYNNDYSHKNEEDDDDDDEDDELPQNQKVERICEQIAILEEHVEEGHDVQVVRQHAKEALHFFFATRDQQQHPSDTEPWFLAEDYHDFNSLSGGQRKKVLLSVALFCQPDVLLLDEPTNHLDVHGLLQLRRLIAMCQTRGTTVLLVSHDVDFINDVATDVVYFAHRQLHYFPGNYDNFTLLRQQQGLHFLRQHVALEKKRQGMLQTLDHLKQQPVPKRGGAKKKARAIASHKKKMNRQGIEKDVNGHRWTQQKAGTGQKQGSINALVDATARRGLNPVQLLKQAQDKIPPPIDKAVQFVYVTLINFCFYRKVGFPYFGWLIGSQLGSLFG